MRFPAPRPYARRWRTNHFLSKRQPPPSFLSSSGHLKTGGFTQDLLLSEFSDASGYIEVTSSIALLPSASASASSRGSGSGSEPSLDPFQVLSLSRALASVTWCGLGAQHALLFAVLYSGLDPSLRVEEAALFSGAAVVCQRSIEVALATPTLESRAHLAQGKLQQTQMRLVAALVGTPAGTHISGEQLRAFTSLLEQLNGVLPRYVLTSLLTIPSAPAYLSAVVDWSAAESGGCLDASLFSLLMHALLNNDNFFSRSHFTAMDSIVKDRILARLGAADDRNELVGAGGEIGSEPSVDMRTQPSVGGADVALFDYISVRWTPLMNKWARAYVRQGQGFALYECLVRLLRAVPSAENKIPCSFYVRTIGGLIDTFSVPGSTDMCAASRDDMAVSAPVTCEDRAHPSTEVTWLYVKDVASRGVRLFGRSRADMRALWVVLLKAALTLVPLHTDWRRLLEAYHLCAEHGHQRPLHTDRGAFLQVIRLTTAAVARHSDLAVVAEAVGMLCRFFDEQDRISFLWMLDAVGVVLRQLWQSHGLAARACAVQLYALLTRLLVERGVTGVQLDTNPVIARAAEDFALTAERPSPFWWTCGCGMILPAAAKRCATCLRRTGGASWMCPECHTPHQTLCADQRCGCGRASPRATAAVACGCTVCGSCGEVLTRGEGACSRCQQFQSQTEAVTACTHCGARSSANALYCSACFTVRRDKQLLLWMCGGCHSLNYSTWSSCKRCSARRRVGCIWVPFLPWRCHCGTLSHPRRLSCDHCSQPPLSNRQRLEHGAGDSQTDCYTCRACKTVVRTSGHRMPTVRLPVPPDLTIVAHLCEHCHTVHPRDQIVLYAPTLPRHCLRCGDVVSRSAVRADGCFYHCGQHQHVNEYFPFRCPHCDHVSESQTGYHCRHCLQPRPDAEMLTPAGNTCFLWRCLRESGPDGRTCGAWNYSWQDRCRACQEGRSHSPWECRARAYAWQCPFCSHRNRPIDFVKCAGCGRSSQPILECDICGVPHLTHTCHA